MELGQRLGQFGRRGASAAAGVARVQVLYYRLQHCSVVQRRAAIVVVAVHVVADKLPRTMRSRKRVMAFVNSNSFIGRYPLCPCP